jgi:hypothetical protein
VRGGYRADRGVRRALHCRHPYDGSYPAADGNIGGSTQNGMKRRVIRIRDGAPKVGLAQWFAASRLDERSSPIQQMFGIWLWHVTAADSPRGLHRRCEESVSFRVPRAGHPESAGQHSALCRSWNCPLRPFGSRPVRPKRHLRSRPGSALTSSIRRVPRFSRTTCSAISLTWAMSSIG